MALWMTVRKIRKTDERKLFGDSFIFAFLSHFSKEGKVMIENNKK
jgi:hypothetical protein